MRKRFFALLIVATVIAAPMALAQEPQFANVLTVHTNLSDGPAYEAHLAKIFAAFKKVGFPNPIQVSTSSSAPGDYTFLVTFANWAEYEEINAKLNEGYASIPAVMAATQETFTHSDQYVWALRPDLAYAPANPRLPADEPPGHMRLTYLYPHPGQALALEGVMKEFAALNAKNGNPNPTNVAQIAVGPDAPTYVIVAFAKDAADAFTETAKWQQKNGAEGQALLQKAGPMLRNIEVSESVPRPDLSYTP